MNTKNTMEEKINFPETFTAKVAGIEDVFNGHRPLKKNEKKILQEVIALGRRFLFDERHALKVAQLSVSLFDQTTGLHGLSADDRLLLAAAGMLHDVGMFISCDRHHKHSMYLIRESEIPGFSPRQIQIIAQIARYHRKSEPSYDHGPFSRLSRSDKELVEKLSAFLRVADVLDREHQQQVRSVVAVIHRHALILKISGVKGKNGVILERSVFKSKTHWFEKRFKVRITVSDGTTL